MMPTVKLTINDKEVEVEKGTLLIEACNQHGAGVPYYCYHPGLTPDGNCRMCLVEVEKAPKPVASCMSQATEGMVVKTNSEEINKIRRSVMEFLLINHPLDCPTCDQSGECRLQDYYMDYDEIPSRFNEEKVQKNKMIDLGANIMLDQERCIACTRCVRFCEEVPKVAELVIANRGDHVTITTFPGKKMTNEYAGNTVDICPVGALTNKDFRFRKRVWLLSRTPSVCPGCSRGCNIEIHHEESQVYRLLPRYNPNVNGYWICDEGRYGYPTVNESRVLRPMVRELRDLNMCFYEEALDKLVTEIKKLPPDEIAVVGHAAETNETLNALHDFGKTVLKTRLLVASRNDPPNPSSDNILRTKDKNPNQAEVDRLKFKPVSSLKKVSGVIILNGVNDDDLQFIKKNKVPVLAVFAVNVTPLLDQAKVVFAVPSYVEQEGHFTNVDGVVQKIEKAYPPRGESKPVVEILSDLQKLLEGTAIKRAS